MVNTLPKEQFECQESDFFLPLSQRETPLKG